MPPNVAEWMALDHPTRLKYFQNYGDIFYGVDFTFKELRQDGSVEFWRPFDPLDVQYVVLLATATDVENWLVIGTNKADAEAYVPVLPRETMYSVKG